jgi:D-alanyl-D-alanine carboxypeptidase/D-alanyl-D-alanine-endopeptidase (penicillin-binding protein 4)
MTGAPGSGDNAYIYFVPGSQLRTIKGTIPAGVKNFTISGSDPNPYTSFLKRFLPVAAKAGFYTGKAERYKYAPWYRNDTLIVKEAKYTYYSPSLDSIIYWFNKKSINLYGEALIKTFALEKQGYASTDSGVAILRRFWKEKGLDPEELNMYDGSGLSPLNRVTTHAQVEILKYAKSRSWFPAFYDALPEYNGMKMKSGTISDVKGYCGYHKAKDGREYIFSFLINNYSGKTSPVVSKMFKVLDELK